MLKQGKDVCENCGKTVEEWQRVCSPACAGALGGKAKVPKGFAVSRELAKIAGAKGGNAKKSALEEYKLKFERY